MPDDKDVGNAGNGVPAPLLRSTIRAESSEQTGQDHDQVGSNSHEDVGTGHASEKTEIEKQKRSGQAPVDIASPEDLAVDVLEGIGDMVMLVTDSDLLDRNAVSSCHCEVRDSGDDGDQGRNDMVQAFRLRDYC